MRGNKKKEILTKTATATTKQAYFVIMNGRLQDIYTIECYYHSQIISVCDIFSVLCMCGVSFQYTLKEIYIYSQG